MRVDVTCLVISILHKILQISIHFLDEKFCSNILLNLLYLFSSSTVKNQKKKKGKEKETLILLTQKKEIEQVVKFSGFFFLVAWEMFLE